MENQSINNVSCKGSEEESLIPVLNVTDEVQIEELISDEHIEKNIFNGIELMKLGDIEQKYLMEPIFPQKGSAVLAGRPDCGKSQFARQLCIQVALGIKEFVGFELNPTHSKSIYIATEDNIDATQFLLNKQVTGLGEKATENIRFMFADTMEQEEIRTIRRKSIHI